MGYPHKALLVSSHGVARSKVSALGKRTPVLSKRALAVMLLAAGLFSTFVSPQLSLLGRGLRASLPMFALLLGWVLLVTPRGHWRAMRAHVVPTLLGIVFVVYGCLQNALQPNPDTFHVQVVSMAVCLMIWISVVMLRTFYPAALEGTRWIVLTVFSISLGAGIPFLMQHPGIARLTAGGSVLNPNNDIGLYANGIGNYSWYTPIAVAWPAIANWITNRSGGGLRKFLAWTLLSVLSLAVILSTFTMALVLLCIGILLWLAISALASRRPASRWTLALLFLILLVAFPRLYSIALTANPTEFATSKATRLIEGTLSNGILAGDDTGRAYMLVESVKTFVRNPIFGAWGFDSSPYFVGGHSSWGDTLALSGVLGLALWVGFLAPSWKRGKRPFSVAESTAGGTFSWILFVIAGVLNPIFGSQVGLLLIWLFDEGGVWARNNTKFSTGVRRAPFLEV